MINSLYEWQTVLDIPGDVELILSSIATLDKQSPEEEWMDCLEILDTYDNYLCYSNENIESSLFPNRCWTFQHHCAYHSAPQSVVEAMKDKSFLFSIKDSNGKLPIHHVDNHMSSNYRELFNSKTSCSKLSLEKLNKVEKILHALLLEVCSSSLKSSNVVLPILSTYFERLHYDGCNDAISLMSIAQVPYYLSFKPEYTEDLLDIEAITVQFGNNIKYRVTENDYKLIERVFS